MVLPNDEVEAMSLGQPFLKAEFVFCGVGKFVFLFLSLLLTQDFLYRDILCAAVFPTYIVSSVAILSFLICFATASLRLF